MPINRRSMKLSHETLMDFMNVFHERGEPGYQIKREGICFGVASMAAQAILTGDLQTFCNRLHHIDAFVNSEEIRQLLSYGGYNEGFFVTEDKKGYEQRIALKAFFDGVALYSDLLEENYNHLSQYSGIPLVHGNSLMLVKYSC